MRIYSYSPSVPVMGGMEFKFDLIKDWFLQQLKDILSVMHTRKISNIKIMQGFPWKVKEERKKNIRMNERKNEKWLTVKWNLFKHHKRIGDCAAKIFITEFFRADVWNWSLFHYYVYFALFDALEWRKFSGILVNEQLKYFAEIS